MRWICFLLAAPLAAQEAAQQTTEKKPATRQESIRKKMEQGLGKQRRAVRKQLGVAVGAGQKDDDWFTVPWTKDPQEDFVTPVAPLPASPLDETKPDAGDPAGTKPQDQSKPPGDAKQASASTVRNFCAPVPGATLDGEIRSAASRNRLSEPLLRALIGRESAFDPCAVSSKGALGLMQLMPATANELGVSDPFDPVQSIQAGARYLAQLLGRYGGDLRLALSAYNAGPAAVDRYGGVPPFAETRDFVDALAGAAPLLRDPGIGADARGLEQ